MAAYSVEAASEWSVGQGPNGTGKRIRVYGHFVVEPNGRRCRAFTGKTSEEQAIAWAARLNNLVEQEIL